MSDEQNQGYAYGHIVVSPEEMKKQVMRSLYECMEKQSQMVAVKNVLRQHDFWIGENPGSPKPFWAMKGDKPLEQFTTWAEAFAYVIGEIAKGSDG